MHGWLGGGLGKQREKGDLFRVQCIPGPALKEPHSRKRDNSAKSQRAVRQGACELSTGWEVEEGRLPGAGDQGWNLKR